MVAVHIRGFRGEIPRVGPRLLQPNQATRARNISLTSGRLDPLPAPSKVTTPALAGVKTVFRYRHLSDDGQNLDNWLVWASDVDAVPSVMANDVLGRVYFSSEDFEPRMTSYAAAIGAAPYPSTSFVLGVHIPTTAPIVGYAGGSGTTEIRSYAYTFVTPFGEESGPSPASVGIPGPINATWNIASMETAPPNSGTVSAAANNTPSPGFVRLTLNTVVGLRQGEQITLSGVVGMTDLNRTHRAVAVDTATNHVTVALTTSQTYSSGGAWTRTAPHNVTGMTKRIYRSAGTEAGFQFVAEIPVAQTSYSDTVVGAALGETLATADTLPPPSNLACLVSLPNGCLAGIAGNELCLSDPYLPDSWPALNRYSFSGRGMALCPTGNSVIVLTDGFPVLFTGTDPEAMSPSVMETYAPCVSKRGTVNIGGGCIYPSHEGLWMAVPGRVENLTKALFREAEWSRLNPTGFVAAFHDGQYVASFTDDVDAAIMMLDLGERDSVVFVSQGATHLLRNTYDGKLYALIDGSIHEWGASESTRYAADWISGTIQLPKPTNFAVAQVHAEFSSETAPDAAQVSVNTALLAAGANAVAGDLNGGELLGAEINASNLRMTDTAGFTRNVQFTLYADGAAVFSKDVTSSNPFRLPGNYRSEVFNIGINASVPVYSVTVAQTPAELATASAP